MTRHERVREALKTVDPELAERVQSATGVQTEFGFPAAEPVKGHDWRFVGMDLEAGALSRFQCARCGCWMSRRSVGHQTKVLYYAAEVPSVWRPLKQRPVCSTFRPPKG